jgi:hypothetical protein
MHAAPLRLWNPPLWEIWDYLKNYPRLWNIAEFHQGIQWNLPLEENKSALISYDPKPGFEKGLDKVPGRIEPYYVKHFAYLNMAEEYRRRKAHLFPWELPKVIANRAVISRGPWRIMGFPDKSGLVCRENFIGIWPNRGINVEVISAIINSPLVNAALYAMEGKRLNRNSTLKQIPIPFPDTIDAERISSLVKQYAKLRSEFEKHPLEKKDIGQCIKTIMEIDGLILKAYDLPPRLERKLLELFRGHPRPVPFNFPDYFPEDFSPCIPLHKYIEMDLKQASAGQLLKRITPFDSEDMHEFFIDIEARQS